MSQQAKAQKNINGDGKYEWVKSIGSHSLSMKVTQMCDNTTLFLSYVHYSATVKKNTLAINYLEVNQHIIIPVSVLRVSRVVGT